MNTQTGTKKKSPRKQRAYRRNRPPVAPILIIGGLLLLTAVVLYFMSQNQSPASVALEGLEQFPNVERGHKEGTLTYAQTPPVGGIHNPVWQNCGVYAQPIRNENGVHSLEHGAVWITYQPGLSGAQIEELANITRQSGYRLLSPYQDLPSPVVVSAWGYQLKLESADDPQLMSFIRQYEQNPRGPEPGAPCTGGEGRPG